MRIARLDASLHRVPVATPLLSRPRPVSVVLVRVETDDGAVGFGVAGAQSSAAVIACLEHDLGPLVVGLDPLRAEAWWHAVSARLNPRAATGIVSCAISGLDLAMWDVRGRILGEPVWRLLGGFTREVPAYVTFGLPEYDDDQLAEVARLVVEQGFGKLKMVVGRGETPQRDIERVARVRDAIGPDVELMVDANCGLDLGQALELCERLEPLGIAFFEEPIVGNDAAVLAELRPPDAAADRGRAVRGSQVAAARSGDRGRRRPAADERTLCGRVHRGSQSGPPGGDVSAAAGQWRRVGAPQCAAVRGGAQRVGRRGARLAVAAGGNAVRGRGCRK